MSPRTALVLVASTILAAPALADGVPEEVKKQAVEQWKNVHAERTKKLKAILAAPTTNADGRRVKMAAQAELKRMEKEPFCLHIIGSPLSLDCANTPTAMPSLTGKVKRSPKGKKYNSFGPLYEPSVKVIIAPKNGEPAFVEMDGRKFRVRSAGEDDRRLFVFDPSIKPNSTGQMIRLTGIYYHTGSRILNGKEYQTLARIEISKEDAE